MHTHPTFVFYKVSSIVTHVCNRQMLSRINDSVMAQGQNTSPFKTKLKYFCLLCPEKTVFTLLESLRCVFADLFILPQRPRSGPYIMEIDFNAKPQNQTILSQMPPGCCSGVGFSQEGCDYPPILVDAISQSNISWSFT